MNALSPFDFSSEPCKNEGLSISPQGRLVDPPSSIPVSYAGELDGASFHLVDKRASSLLIGLVFIKLLRANLADAKEKIGIALWPLRRSERSSEFNTVLFDQIAHLARVQLVLPVRFLSSTRHCT